MERLMRQGRNGYWNIISYQDRNSKELNVGFSMGKSVG